MMSTRFLQWWRQRVGGPLDLNLDVSDFFFRRALLLTLSPFNWSPLAVHQLCLWIITRRAEVLISRSESVELMWGLDRKRWISRHLNNGDAKSRGVLVFKKFLYLLGTCKLKVSLVKMSSLIQSNTSLISILFLKPLDCISFIGNIFQFACYLRVVVVQLTHHVLSQTFKWQYAGTWTLFCVSLYFMQI